MKPEIATAIIVIWFAGMTAGIFASWKRKRNGDDRAGVSQGRRDAPIRNEKE